MSLRKSPVVDSDELGALRHRELDVTREPARSLGLSALAAICEGRYVADGGQLVDWKADVEKAPPPTSHTSASRAPVTSWSVAYDAFSRSRTRTLFDTLVLGAWGCGAFGNDPVRTAGDFRAALEGDFDGAFRQVTFAITDWSPDLRFLGPFRDAFSLVA